MSLAILTRSEVESLESKILASEVSLAELIEKAVLGCSFWIKKNYPMPQDTNVGLLVGPGHNGADALGIGTHLCAEGRTVIALLVVTLDHLKPMTQSALTRFQKAGGNVIFIQEQNITPLEQTILSQSSTPSLWIDGLHGFGINRPLSGLHALAVRMITSLQKPVIAIDIPSGLHPDFGLWPQDTNAPFIKAQHTLALGCLKPIHVLDDCLNHMGEVHWIDLGYDDILKTEAQQINCNALTADDLQSLLKTAQRSVASHKVSNGRLLVIAGSKKYPGAAVMSCLGAGISGAGMLHACVPAEARQAILLHAPEIIFEESLPEDLSPFDAILLGPGWVPVQEKIIKKIIEHVQKSKTCRFVFDAGAFAFLKDFFARGQHLNDRCILTPHSGEFARLFPEIWKRFSTKDPSLHINRFDAALWAARACHSIIYLKGARSCIAEPQGRAQIVFQSSSLLAHAGHGDVLAGLLAGLLARDVSFAEAPSLAALLQSQTALAFSAQNPAALTLQPSELVRQMQRLQLRSSS